MLKSILSKGFTFALIGVSISLFYQYSFLWGTLALIWGISRLFGYSLRSLGTDIGQINRLSELEKKANCYMEFRFNVEKLLQHPEVDALFERLKGKNLVRDTKEEWRDKLIASYKKRFKKEDPLEVVKFNIKNNILWKNGEVDFIDSVYHGLFIPYNPNVEKDSYLERVDTGLTIRVFIVNATVKLQIGDFSKELSPKILRDGGLATYQRYQTITALPLLYFCSSSGIPEHYLNMSFQSTNWKWALGNGNKNTETDWSDLNRDLRDYYQLVNATTNDFINDKSQVRAIMKRFKEVGGAILKKEGFKDPYATEGEEDYHDDFFDTNDVHYANDYLSVFISNTNDLKEKREAYLYPDYWEDRP